MNINKVLVTGASGFTGRQVVSELLKSGYKVRGLIRDKRAAKSLEEQGVEPMICDLSDTSNIDSVLEGIDAVIHIAAIFRQAGLPTSSYFKVNRDATEALLEAACKVGAQRFIHCSTVGVHGSIEQPPATENAPFSPGDVYQESKLEGELVAKRYFEQGKISGVIIRPAMIYGPGDTRTLKLFKMIARRQFFYVGPGDKFVHFIDVRDLARAFVLALKNTQITNETFIISGAHPLPLKSFAQRVAKLLNVPSPWLRLPVKPMQLAGSICEAICTPLKINPPLYRRRVDFFTKNRHFDSTKAKELLGFEPKQGLDEELRDIIRSYLKLGYISAAGPATLLSWFNFADWKLPWSKFENFSQLPIGLINTILAELVYL